MRSLYAKLALVLLALFGVVAALYVVLTLATTRMYSEEINQKLNRPLAATIAREKPMVHDGRIDRAMLNQVFDALMAVNPDIEIYLLDRDGNIVAFSAPPGKVKRRRVSLDPVRAFLRGERLPIRGDDPRDLVRTKIFSATPLDGGQYLYVILGGEQYDSVAQQMRGSYILQQSAVIAVAALVFAVVAGLLLFAVMTRRLRRLAAAVDLAWPAPGAGDEVDRLARAFEQQLTKLREMDQHRRELIANVSHDLRTPLASLRGYLDTLLMKEGQLAPDEQRRFLQIAGRHSERLGKLIDELFELAKLDSQATPLHAEPFSMAELVQDIAQKFQLRAEQAGVALAAEFRPNLPPVRGDIALIERVLENLIENALRHTPPGGSVTIAATEEAGRVVVRVADTGNGIAAEDLPHVFDRFYSRGGGTGLGLAIAKRIVELHGSALEVESRAGEGTEFWFGVGGVTKS